MTKDHVLFVEILQKSKPGLQDMPIGWTSFQLGEKLDFTSGKGKTRIELEFGFES